MRISEILKELNQLMEKGDSAALATIIAGEGSTPRKIGAKMLIRPDGSTMGTIGGGIVEAQVIKRAVASIKNRCLEVAS
ncbi:MAG TPA: XdhC family protein, partial [Candidatus Sumerlaeia bacterium]|nr:XdhC family protein [Candidatus Sumerlaeia bacterium]